MKAFDLLILVIIKNEKQILYMECCLAKVRSIINSECNVLFSSSWPFNIFQSRTVDSIINETLFISTHTFMSCQAHLFLILWHIKINNWPQYCDET